VQRSARATPPRTEGLNEARSVSSTTATDGSHHARDGAGLSTGVVGADRLGDVFQHTPVNRENAPGSHVAVRLPGALSIRCCVGARPGPVESSAGGKTTRVTWLSVGRALTERLQTPRLHGVRPLHPRPVLAATTSTSYIRTAIGAVPTPIQLGRKPLPHATVPGISRSLTVGQAET
jgi:hypothetical protein